MGSSESDGESCWNIQLINVMRKKQGKGNIITEDDIFRELVDALKQGANIDVTDGKSGNTALHTAVRRGFQKIIKCLVQRGASTDILNFKGETAITLAQKLGEEEIVSILQKPFSPQSGLADCESTGVRDLLSAVDNEQPSTSQDSKNGTQHNSNEIKTFAAGATLTRSWPGNVYQLKQLAFTLQCASQQKQPYYFLATEMIEAEKLDDVVLLYKDESGKQVGRFVQIKYGINQKAEISAQQLLEAGGNLSVLNYFKSWRKVKSNPLFSHIESRNMILCTNIGIDLKDLNKNEISYVKTEEPDKSFELKSQRKPTAWYQVVAEQECNEKVYRELRATSDLYELASKFAERISDGKSMRMETDIFQYYHVALVEHVLNPKSKQLHDNFIENRDLSPQVQKFREIFISEYKTTTKRFENDASEELILKDVVEQIGKLENFRQDFGKPPKVANPELTEINELSDRFVELLKNAADSHIVRIATKTSRAEGAEQPIKVIVDNLKMLSGHVFIEDDRKIKFSPQFLKDKEQSSGNVGELKNALKNKLQNKYELNLFVFDIQNYKPCTKRQLLAKDEFPDDYVEDSKISEFLEEFTLAVNQPDNDEINDIIRLKMDGNSRFNMLNTELLVCAFEKKILDWFIRRGDRGNEKEYIWCKVGEDFLDELDQEVGSLITIGVNSKYCERMKALNLLFKSEMPLVRAHVTADTSHVESPRILQLVAAGNTSLTALRVYDTLQRIPKYKKMDSFIFIELDNFRSPLILKTVMSTFNSLQYPDLLIIDCGSDNIEKYFTELWNPLCEFLARNRNKKMILITQTDKKLRTSFTDSRNKNIEHAQTLKIGYDEIDDYKFRHLADQTQKKLLKIPVSQFQGHESKTSLGELLGIRDQGSIEEAELQDLSEIIDSSTLLDLICEDELNLCNDLEPFAEKDYYINRVIRRCVIIRKDIFEDEEISDLFAISGGHKKISAMLGGTAEKIPSRPQNMQKITILDSGQEEEQFRSLCNKNFAKLNIHWLKKDSGKYIWEKSEGNITNLVKYSVTDCDHTDLIYLMRMDNFTTSGFYNEDIETHATCMKDSEMAAHNEPMIVSSIAGMGKSTMLTYLSWKLKENQPDMLVIKINLNNHVEAFLKVQGTSSYNICDENGAVEFLVTEWLKRETNLLARKVIRRMINEKSKVALIFDGFDEISPHYEETVLSLLGALGKHGIEKLFIGTRPHAKKALEIKLKVFSYDIQPFSTDNRTEFLTKFLKNNKYCIEKAQAIFGILTKSIDDRTNTTTKIPLQVKMVAEVLQSQTSVAIDSREEFLPFRGGKQKLPGEINLIYLYKHFVEMKFDYFFKKRDANLALIDVRYQRDVELDRFIGTHTKLALDALFGADKVKEFGLIATDNRSAMVRYGIITQFNDDGQPQFGHRSYAEYFAATFIADVIKNGNLCESKQKFVIVDVLMGNNYQNTRAFINCLWAEKNDDAFGVNCGEFNLDKHRGIGQETILHVAVAEGNDHILEKVVNYLCLKKDSEKAALVINSPDHDGDTPLTLAAFRGSLKAVEYLCNMGANVDSERKDGSTPLHLAAQEGKSDVVQYLLSKEANVNSEDKDGLTPLHAAARMGLFNVVKYLLSQGANVNSEDKDGLTPLHSAAGMGRLNVVEYLLNKGANVNSEMKNDCTPLHLAAQEGKLDVVQYLLSKGANVNSEYKNGWTPLHLAAQEGQLDVVQYLLSKEANVISEDNDGLTPLHSAAGMGRLNVVEYLLSKGANVNSEMKNDCTPLHLAAQEGKLDVVQYLLSKGANVNSENKDSLTPLHAAVSMGRFNVVKCLLSQGANVNSEIKDGRTPLHAAAEEGKLVVVKYLLSKGANVNSGMKNGWTPLHAAAEEGKLDVVKYLLNKGAHVNSENQDGSTPLRAAAGIGRFNVVEYLLSKGANVNSEKSNGGTPLHAAAGMGRFNVVEYLLSKGANVNSEDKDGWTPLHAAAQAGESDVVKYLLSKGANVNSEKSDGGTPLHAAAVMGRLNVVQYLLSQGANMNSEDKDGWTPLHAAAEVGKSDIVQYLLSKGANVNSEMKDGWTPLHTAAQSGESDVVQYLLSKGANVNSENKDSFTPLHAAATMDRLSVVKYLLSQGANVNSEDKDGWTPLHAAAQAGKLDVVKYLLSKGANVKSEIKDGSTPLHAAAGMGRLNVVQYLLSKEANVNSEKRDGGTPLHAAAGMGRFNVVEYLLSKGADVNPKDKDGGTPLHAAAGMGRLNVVEYLLSRGANVNSKDKDGWTPLHVAAQEGVPDVVQYLLSKGANVNSENKDGTTPLYAAAQAGKSDVIKYLLSKGANVNFEKRDGGTPLHAAAGMGHFNVVQYLLSKGANMNSENKDGWTPLHAAAGMGRLNVVEYLLSKGANVNSEMKNDCTPLHLAAQEGKLDVVQYLLSKGANVNSEKKDCLTPLHAAVSMGRFNVVKCLLSQGADVNSEDKDGSTPLHAAAGMGRLNVVQYLLSKGANVNSEKRDGGTPLHAAAVMGCLNVVEYLLSQGANVNSEDKNHGLTPLHVAALEGKSDIVEYLLSKGANVNFENKYGLTPLHVAAQVGKSDVVQYLLSKGANVDSEMENGWTPLHMAAYSGGMDIVKYLLGKGANINIGNSGMTPLYVALREGKWAVAKYLYRKGATFNF